MDIRTERTTRSIIQAFIQLRTEMEPEEMNIKDLVDLAGINKATFYRHYPDIATLADSIEDSMASACVQAIPRGKDLLEPENTALFASAFLGRAKMLGLVFSGNRMETGVRKLHARVMRRILQSHPEIEQNVEKKIILSASVYGNIYACFAYQDQPRETLIRCLVRWNLAQKRMLDSIQ